MNNRRGRLLIEPRFQLQFMIRLSAWTILSTFLTALLGALIIAATGKLLPALAVCLPLNLTLTLLFALYYSQKLAGPVHRLEQDMLKVSRGEKVDLHFQLRDSDEFQQIAHAFDALLKSLGKEG